MLEAHRQSSYDVRLDWGLTGATAIVEGVDVAIVVDVLSFTTTVTVALDAGITVWPYPWSGRGTRAVDFAARQGATLAVGRTTAGPGQVSLSPASVAAAVDVSRLVLPSPNGSSIAAALADAGCVVLAASLRNASAVADWIVERDSTRDDAGPGRIAIIAAGERWPDGELRPAVEDLWGAGAVAAQLQARGRELVSPEARLAADAYRSVSTNLREELLACASGRELVDSGFGDNVEIAAAVNVTNVVPELVAGRFSAARRPLSPPVTTPR